MKSLGRFLLLYVLFVNIQLGFSTNDSITQANKEYPFRRGNVRSRLSIGPAKGFYKNHELHTTNTQAKSGILIQYQVEYFLGKKVNLMGGLGYYNQGFTFQGYYDLPGHTNVYNKIYAYSHDISLQEVDMPLGIKLALSPEKDTYFSAYYSGGLSLRYIINSQNLIVNDSVGVTMYQGKGDIGFENNLGKLFNMDTKGVFNAFLYSGFGAQYNFRGTARALFFEIIYRYGISRFNYRGNNNSNSLDIRNSNLVFAFGVRF